MPATAYSPSGGIKARLDQIDIGESRGFCALGPRLYTAAVKEAGGTRRPGSFLKLAPSGRTTGRSALKELMFSAGFRGTAAGRPCSVDERNGFMLWCQEPAIPFLGVSPGLCLMLNTRTAQAGYPDLRRELPQALQHQHVPEAGTIATLVVTRRSPRCAHLRLKARCREQRAVSSRQ